MELGHICIITTNCDASNFICCEKPSPGFSKCHSSCLMPNMWMHNKPGVCRAICFHAVKGNNETNFDYKLKDNQMGAFPHHIVGLIISHMPTGETLCFMCIVCLYIMRQEHKSLYICLLCVS